MDGIDSQTIRGLLDNLFALHDQEMVPASPESLRAFREASADRGVPADVVEQLEAFYRITNGVPCVDGFDFHACEDIILYEWWDQRQLWLGQRDMDTLRWTEAGFCLGDSGDASYGPEYEFQTLGELIEGALKDWYGEAS